MPHEGTLAGNPRLARQSVVSVRNVGVVTSPRTWGASALLRADRTQALVYFWMIIVKTHEEAAV